MNSFIMIVDDNQEMKETMKDRLENAGFTHVIAYSNPLEALAEIQRGAKPSLVISDYDMPQMDGHQLLEQIANVNPQIRSLIVTGGQEAIHDFGGKYVILLKNTSTFFSDLVEYAKSQAG